MKSVRIHQGYLYHQRSCYSLSSMAMDLRSTPRHRKTKASSSTLDRSTAGVDMGGWCCVSLGFVVVEIDELSCESVELHSTRVISCFLPCFISELPGRCSRVFCFNVSLVSAPRNIMKSLDKKTRGTPPWRDPIFQWNTILGRDTQYKNHLLYMRRNGWRAGVSQQMNSYEEFDLDHSWHLSNHLYGLITESQMCFLGLFLMLLLLSTSLRINFHVE